MKGKQLSYSAFLKRVKDTIKHYDMLHKGDRVLAAVSGGVDSMCLLRVLLDIRKMLGIEVVVGNMDHGLRGKESADDSAFVKDTSEELGVTCIHKKTNVRTGGKKGTSTEEKAREKRYAFLRKAAVDNNCNVIATGHTMNDQAETVLMRVIYGSSLAGIAGISPVRNEGSQRLIRPLIRTGRQDIVHFIKKCGLKYVEDKSNRDVRFIRNRVRHEILPFLMKYNPKLTRSLANLSDTSREDLLFLAEERKKNVSRVSYGGMGVSITIKDILLQPKAIRKDLFKELFQRSGGNVKKLTYRHWIDMDYFLRTAEKGKSLDLPGNVRVIKYAEKIVFSKRS